ncbi:YccT family protein [Shewanella donghaensis]|uniref:YccT family protein n=1 Tax=Shewanella donghaensis TaxID=238836 RepID=UPI001182890E|nr:DUF2057 domain-containing protein [Shewanella donghaensis]
MKLRQLSIGLLTILTTPFALAAGVLDIPNSVEVIVLNGQEKTFDDEVPLVEGENQLVFRYLTYYRDHGTQTQFKSEAVILKFNAQDERYEISLPNIRNKNNANSFNQSPKFTLVNSQNKPVNFEQGLLKKEGLQLGREYQLEINEYNLTNQPAAMASISETVMKPSSESITTPVSQTITAPAAVAAAVVATTSTTQPIVKAPKTIAEDQAEITEMLDYWYNKANDETKAKFKAKVNNSH